MGAAKTNGTVQQKQTVLNLTVIDRKLYVNGRPTCIYPHGWVLPEMLEIAAPLMQEAREHFGGYDLGRAVEWWSGSMWSIYRGGEKLGLPDLKREARDKAIERAFASLCRRISRSRRKQR